MAVCPKNFGGKNGRLTALNSKSARMKTLGRLVVNKSIKVSCYMIYYYVNEFGKTYIVQTSDLAHLEIHINLKEWIQI